MLEEAVTTLALTGATTVVAAMATDAWQGARDGVARLFGRQGEERQALVAAQLDGNAALVARAGDADRVRRGVVPLVQLHLEELLRDHPETGPELDALVVEVTAALPQPQQSWVQHVTARGGVAAGAMGPGSSVHVHYHSATPPDPDGGEER